MSTIDKRIVEMEFENKDFEKGIKDSEKSLKEFDKALRDAGSGGNSLSSLGGIAEGVGGKFSALGLVAAGALMSIGAMAVDVGMQIVKAFTLDQVMDGFIEYELKMNAIRVMMASGITKEGLPVTLEQVNKHLEDLNVYADRTIYSFKDMTRTIGQFTNAGVNVELAVTSIKGISNAAALAGASTEEAGRAMDAFAKALAFGHVSLRQWRSIELSKLGTVEFKTQLLDAAVAAGTLEKQADGMYKVLTAGATTSKMGNVISATKEFSYSLHNQWLTTEVLTDTLEKYGDVTTDIGKKADEAATTIRTFSMLKANVTEAIASGWGVTFERIIGDFNESAEFFTWTADTLEGIILKANDARNDLLQEWKDLGGRDDIFSGIKSAWYQIALVLRQAKKAFNDVFPPATAQTLLKISSGFKNLMSNIIPKGSENVAKITQTFRNLFRGLSHFLENISNIFGALGQAFGAVFSKPTLDQLLNFARGFNSFMKDIKLSAKSIEYLKTIFQGLFSIVSLAGKFIFSVFKGIYDGIRGVLDLIPTGEGGGILGFLSRIATFFIDLNDAAEKGETFAKISKTIADALIWLGEKIKGFIAAIKESETLKSIFTTVGEVIGWFVLKIRELIDIIKESETLNLIFGKIKDTFGQFSDVDTTKFTELKDKLKDFFSGIAEKLGPAWDKVKEILTKIKEFIAEKWDTEGLGGLLDILEKILKSGVLVALMNFLNNKTAVGAGAGGIKGLLEILNNLGDALKTWQQSINANNILKIAAAVGILALSLLLITLLDKDKLFGASLAIAAFFLELTGGMLALNKLGSVKKVATQMLLMAGAILILAIAMNLLKDVDPKAMWALSFMIAELVAVNLLLTKFGGDSGKGTANLLGMAAAILILALVIRILGKMDPKDMWQGVLAVGALMAGMLIFSVIMGNFGGAGGANVLAAAAAMVIMALAMLQFVAVIALLSAFSPEQLTQSGIALAGIMIIIGGGLLALANPQVLFGAAAMLLVAAALAIFVPALATLGSLPLATIGIGLLAIAGLFVILGIAGYVLAPVLPIIIGLAVAVALLGVAVLAAGAGIMMFGIGLNLIALAGFGAVAVLIFAIKEITSLLPFILTKIGEAIVAFAGVIKEGAPAIFEAFGAIIIGLLDLIADLVPKILETVGTLLTAILEFIVEKVPEILNAVGELITAILDFLVEKIPELVDAGYKILLGFLEGIGNNIQQVVEAAYDIMINLLNGIATKLPELITAGADVVIAYIEGITTEIPRVVDTAFQLIIDFINGLADSIRTNTPLILKATENLATAFIDGVKTYLNIGEGESIAGSIITGLINGITNGVTSVVNAAIEMGKSMLAGIMEALGMTSPSKEFAKIGMDSNRGLVLGLTKSSGLVVDATERVGKSSLEAFRSTMSNIADIIDGDLDTSPVITPVLNLDKMRSGAHNLDSLLSMARTYGLAVQKVSHDRGLPDDNQNGSNLLKESGTTINNEFNLNGVTIRSEADINLLAEKLFRMQENAMRVRGIRPGYSS